MNIYLEYGKSFVWQWDSWQRVVLEGYPVGTVVHYANCKTQDAPVVETRQEGDLLVADIPPELMQEPHNITAYACDENGTLHSHVIMMRARPKPESYVYEPVKILRYETLSERIRKLEEQPAGMVELDTTLTQSGKAADSKAVGEEISRVENKIPTTPEDIGALPNTYMPPDQTAEQVGADPAGTAEMAMGKHNTSAEAHSDIRMKLQTLEALADIMVRTKDIVDNLVTDDHSKPLSAAQGAELNRSLAALAGIVDDLKGSLNGYALADTVPTKISQLQNDAGYLTEHQDISGKADKEGLGFKFCGNLATHLTVDGEPVGEGIRKWGYAGINPTLEYDENGEPISINYESCCMGFVDQLVELPGTIDIEWREYNGSGWVWNKMTKVDVEVGSA